MRVLTVIPEHLIFIFLSVAEMLCAQLAKTVAVSSTYMCGLKNEYSYVLQNIGFSEARASSSIRLCFGKSNTEQEVITAAKEIAEKVT